MGGQSLRWLNKSRLSLSLVLDSTEKKYLNSLKIKKSKLVKFINRYLTLLTENSIKYDKNHKF